VTCRKVDKVQWILGRQRGRVGPLQHTNSSEAPGSFSVHLPFLTRPVAATLYSVTVPRNNSADRRLPHQLHDLRTGDANLRFLRFCITTLKDGWRKFAFLHYNYERRMTQICVFALQLWKTGYANLRFCITTVKDGWRKFAFLHYNCERRMTKICIFALQLWKTDEANLRFNTRLVFTHLITQYMERFLTGPPGRMFKKTWLYFELMICDKYRGKKIPVLNVLSNLKLKNI
jgi:hypothetical protein